MKQQLGLLIVYDGTIKASETVGRTDVLVGFYGKTGFTFGYAIQWKPRTKKLVVKHRILRKRYELEKELVKYALIGTENGDRDKFRIEWG